MTREAIEQLIPHRAPMLLLDEIVEQGEKSIRCRKTVRSEEYFLQGHYPGFPLVPGVILCEIGMQAGAVLLATLAANIPGVPVVTRLNNVKFKRMIRPGDTVEAAAKLTEQMGKAYFLEVKVTCDGQLAVSFDFACTLSEPTGPTPPGTSA